MKLYLVILPLLRKDSEGIFLKSRAGTKMFPDWLPLKTGVTLENLMVWIFHQKYIAHYGVPCQGVFDFLLGLVTGIPFCCNFQYSFLHKRGEERDTGAGYIVCPYCLRHNRFTVPREYVFIAGD